MKTIRTFSTSANLGPGFDAFGICFDLYNDYSFEINNEYKIIGFDEKYTLPENNLIIKAYEKVFEYLNKKIIYITLKQKEQNIPTSRGLGSSASCIVTGVMIANEVLDSPLSKDEIFQIASSIEGHPDNVAPLIYGGFTCSFKDGIYYKIQLEVSKNLEFMVCIPPFELSTALARSVLPKEITVKDAVFNLSHAVAMVKAIELGDMNLLKQGKKDLIHEPYRYPLIKDSNMIIDYAKENNLVCMISGAGSTLLLVGKNIKDNIELIKGWKFIKVKVNNKGAYLYDE